MFSTISEISNLKYLPVNHVSLWLTDVFFSFLYTRGRFLVYWYSGSKAVGRIVGDLNARCYLMSLASAVCMLIPDPSSAHVATTSALIARDRIIGEFSQWSAKIDSRRSRRLVFHESLLREDPFHQARQMTFEETKSRRRDHQRRTVGHSCSVTSRVRMYARACVRTDAWLWRYESWVSPTMRWYAFYFCCWFRAGDTKLRVCWQIASERASERMLGFNGSWRCA